MARATPGLTGGSGGSASTDAPTDGSYLLHEERLINASIAVHPKEPVRHLIWSHGTGMFGDGGVELV